MAEYKREIGVAVTVAVVLAAVIGVVAIYSFPTSKIPSVTSVVTVSNSTTVFSSIAPCGSPGVYCGGVQISSGSLTINGNSSVLRVILTESGNSYIGSATVYVNGTVIGVPPASKYEPPGNIILNVEPRQQTVLVLTIPNNTINVQVGKTYAVLVYFWEGPPGQRASEGNSATVSLTAT